MHTLAGQLHHLPTAAHTHAAQAYEGYLQAHTPPNIGAAIGITFIFLCILLGLKAGLSRGSRD